MDIVSIFAIVILLISIGTLMIGVAAYIAFKVRSARGPKPIVHGYDNPVDELMFLKPYVPEQQNILSLHSLNSSPMGLNKTENNIQQT
ncbi:hypothetical protein [Polynucleobacter rarus]|jgi:hypothetical protein|uniref:hypothetical protein n=1 Tax=Polynucleobacter rarus TaxID=556055 RepID=UPI000D3E2B9C|nr:hypothetical protein [Polynucleobacter rarus]